MSININGETVHVEHDSSSADYAVKYLQKLDPSETKNFFKTAAENGYSHFECAEHYEDRHLEHNMTLEHRGDGSYYLRKRD
jgi:hypothetical protein